MFSGAEGSYGGHGERESITGIRGQGSQLGPGSEPLSWERSHFETERFSALECLNGATFWVLSRSFVNLRKTL